MDSILQNFLAPTLALRLQACHALGGLAQGAIAMSFSPVHAHISSQILEFLFAAPVRFSPKKRTSPIRPPTVQESDICRTLRTTLNTEDLVHVKVPFGHYMSLVTLSSSSVQR